jgi:hypothetical protein
MVLMRVGAGQAARLCLSSRTAGTPSPGGRDGDAFVSERQRSAMPTFRQQTTRVRAGVFQDGNGDDAALQRFRDRGQG